MNIASILIIIGSAITIFMGLAQVVLPNRTRLNKIASVLFWSTGLLILHSAVVAGKYQFQTTWTILGMVTALYLIGPCSYFYYQGMVDSSLLKGRLWPHFVPAMVAFPAELIFHLQGHETKMAIFGELFVTGFERHPIVLLPGPGILSIMIYFAVLFRHSYKIYTSSQDAFQIQAQKTVLAFNLYCFTCILIYVGGFLADEPWAYLLAGILLTILYIGIFLNQFQSPQRYQMFKPAGRGEGRGVYTSSRLEGLNLAEIKKKLAVAMHEQKMYRDSDLTLEELAREIGLTAHQLSEYLNRIEKKNFYNYINSLRVEESIELIRRQPNTTLLDIGYSVGFNSKAAFNKSFLKFAGHPPSHFRK